MYIVYWATAEQNHALLHFGSNIKANSPICCLVWIQWSKSEVILLPKVVYNCLAGVNGVLTPGQCSWTRVSPGGYPVAGWDKLKGQPCLSSGLGSLWAWKQATLKGWKEQRANPLPSCVTWGKSSYLLSPDFTQLTSQAWANVEEHILISRKCWLKRDRICSRGGALSAHSDSV